MILEHTKQLIMIEWETNEMTRPSLDHSSHATVKIDF